MADIIKIRSTTDATVSLYNSLIPIRKVWTKRGAVVPIERDKAVQLYYNSSLENALRNGLLAIDDKEFLYEIGFIEAPTASSPVMELTTTLMDRCISVMPLQELKQTLAKLSTSQVSELVEYAITNNTKLKMDRIDLLGKVSGKNILKAIELFRASQED